jgi:hypothetical protein
LPELLDVPPEGLTDAQITAVLDDVDRSVTEPMLQSGEWSADTAPVAEMLAALTTAVSPALIPALQPDTSDAVHAGAVLAADAPETMRQGYEQRYLELQPAGQLNHLYRQIENGEIDFAHLRSRWHTFQPARFAELWRYLPIVSGKPRTHADLMKMWRYDPLTWLVFIVTLDAPLEGGTH